MIPRTFERFIAFALTGIVGFALVSVPLAMIGIFRPAPVSIATAVAWFAIWRVCGRWDRTDTETVRSGSSAAKRATATTILVVVVVTGLNVRYSSQHLMTERDPGVYNTTAVSMARTGRIFIDPNSAPYRGAPIERRIHFEAAGFFRDADSGEIHPQFVHLFQAALGASSWVVGARGMLKVNALLGASALLVFFAFCTRILPAWAGAAATAALAVNLVQVNFTRDSYTEILTQILLFGGLWALLDARPKRDVRRAVIAGVLFGTATMARADAFIFLVPLVAYISYELIVAPNRRDERLRKYLIGLAAGAAVPTVIAGIDLRFYSPAYLADNWRAFQVGFLGLVVAIVAGAAYIALRPRLTDARRWFFERRHTIATMAAFAIVVVAVFAYYIRPHIQHTYGDEPSSVVELVQMREGLPIDPSRTFGELSLRWLGLYLGPVALWIGIVGLAAITREIVLGRSRRLVPFMLAMGSMTALYVWDPAITPDHLWALRRFLPITIPGLIVCCFWVLARTWRAAKNDRGGVVTRGLALAAAAFVIAFPVWTLQPFIRERSQTGVLNVTERLCDRLPEDAAVLVGQTLNLDQNFMQTIRSFCEVPVASAPMDQPMDFYAELARRWAAAGRSFWVVSPQANFGTFWPPTSDQVGSTQYRTIEKTLMGRPDGFEAFDFGLFIRRVDPPSNGPERSS